MVNNVKDMRTSFLPITEKMKNLQNPNRKSSSRNNRQIIKEICQSAALLKGQIKYTKRYRKEYTNAEENRMDELERMLYKSKVTPAVTKTIKLIEDALSLGEHEDRFRDIKLVIKQVTESIMFIAEVNKNGNKVDSSTIEGLISIEF